MPAGISVVGWIVDSFSWLSRNTGMASADKISALRGMRDVFSAEYANRRQIENALSKHFRLHSYVPIDLPILENTELYLRKSGEDIAARLYEFHFKSRRIAMRPEVTASIIRAYVEHLQDEPLPLRIQYGGPVFRYEKPQLNRYRQFTLCGAELIGSAGPLADAEILHLACSGLERLGIRDYKLVIGHTDVLEGFLDKLALRKQLKNFLLRNMENLRKRGRASVIESLRSIYPEYSAAADAARASDQPQTGDSQQLINVLRDMTDGEAHQAITDFLHSLNIRIDTNRDEGEVIDRLLHKIREDRQGPKLQIALDCMQRLGELAGSPKDVLKGAYALATDFGLDTGALAALESTIHALADFGAPCGEIQLDFGLSRGLHYYTGLIFEIHQPSNDGEEIQLCGGGRYDNLVSILGGAESIPAAGFAYGVERIASLLDTGESVSLNRPAVSVIPVTSADIAACLALATALRTRDIVTEVDTDGRSLRRALKQADRRGAALVIIIGEAEREAGQAILRDMRSHQERQLAFDTLPSEVAALLSEGG